MSRNESRLKIIAEIWAYLITPIAIFFGYNYAGSISAMHFRITDPGGDMVAGLAMGAVLLASVQLWPIPAAHRRALSLLWLIRIGVALGFMLPYEAFYKLDAIYYYLAGTHLSNPLGVFRFGDGTRNIIGTVGILSAITTSYAALKLVFAYIGLLAIYIMYRAATAALRRDVLALLYILGMFPSLLFWSSILGKDPLTLLGIAIFIHGATGIMAGRGLWPLFYVALGLTIACFIRIWLGAVFLTPLLVAVVLGGRLSTFLKVVFLAATIPLFLAALQGFADQFSLESAADIVSRTDAISQSWAKGGSAQRIEGGFKSLTEMILFMPFGAFTALFRPLPGEILNAFGFMAGLENAFLLFLIVNGIARRGFSWVSQPLLLWSVLTVGAWAAIYGFASYQNLGTAFRFHIQVLPILLTVGLYLNFSSAVRLPRREPRFLTVGTTPDRVPGEG